MTAQRHLSGQNISTKDLPNLDLLRTFAILYVVISHVMGQIGVNVPPNLAWLGLTGVFMFFTHTSTVLMWSLERKPHPMDFYIRRIFRIYPAAIVIVLITVLFKLPAMHTGFATGFVYTRPSLYDVVCNLLLLQNLHGIQIVGVMWSLPLEMQMYIVLPVLFFFVIRYRALWTLLLLWLLTVVTLQSIFRTYASPPMNLVTCGPYFLPGVMAYIGFGSRKPILPAWSFPLFLLGLTAVFLYTSPSLTHAWWFCLILGVSVPFFKQVRMEAVRKIVQKIAQYSYGIYLTHTFANYIGIAKLHEHSLFLRLGVIAGGIAIFSFAMYHLIEKPFIDLGVRVARRAERFYETATHPQQSNAMRSS